MGVQKCSCLSFQAGNTTLTSSSLSEPVLDLLPLARILDPEPVVVLRVYRPAHNFTEDEIRAKVLGYRDRKREKSAPTWACKAM